MENKDIAIVGMSCFAPGAENISQFWNNLVNGVDSITDVPTDRIDQRYFSSDIPAVDRFYCKRGGFVPDITFDPVRYSMLPVAVEGMDSVHLLAMKMVYQALEDAAVFEKNISLKKSALIIGKGNYVGSAIWRAMDIVHVGEQVAEVVKNVLPDLPDEEVDKIKKAYQKSKGRFQADSMPGLIPNLIASLIANKLDMQGPAYTIDAACASSLIALEHSIKELHSKRCDIAVAGGVHAGQNAPFWSIFSQLGALSYKQKITPFSEDADGLLIGEGGGFIVLKRLEDAIADKDRIYSVIKGIGVSSDGSGVSVMAPSVKGQKIAIEEAWKNANMDPKRLGYIEAHGTATVIGDKTELTSLDSAFPNEEGANQVLLGSVKSNIGHAMPAAGMLGLIKTVLALYNRQIPPTLHCERPIKAMEATRFRPAQKLEEWDENKYPLIAGVNAFGFGGINAHVIVEAYGEKEQAPAKQGFTDNVLIASASNKEQLIEMLKSGNTTSAGDLTGDYRLVLFDPTPERIDKAIKLIAKDKSWKGRQDIWFSNEPLLKNGGKVVFLYPGFDPTSNPEVDSLAKYFNIDIPEDKIESNKLLEHVFRLYRCSEAMSESLKRIGIKSDMNAGHSLGEWFGLKASGCVPDSSARAILESLDPEQYTIDGIYFIALGCGRERISDLLNTIPDLYLSNDNCPNQVLLCGTKEALNTLIPRLQEEQIYYQVLSFQSGFHTPFIKGQLNLLDEGFHLLKLQKAVTPMWSCTSLEVYPESPEELYDLTKRHITEGIQFRGLLEKLYNEEDAKVFVQIGAGSLIGFVDDTLKDKSYSSISMATHLRSTLEQMRRVLALLYIEGKDIDTSFIGANAIKNSRTKNMGKEMKLQMSMDIIQDFPLLKQVSSQYQTKSVDIDSLSIDTSHPILAALDENIKEIATMHVEMAKVFQKKIALTHAHTQQVKQVVPQVERVAPQVITIEPQEVSVPEKKEGQSFVEDLHISLKTHPALIDHSLISQPDYWTRVEDMNPVIPMTMTFELLIEAAHKQALSKKVTRLSQIGVFQWMSVAEPFVQKIEGTWKTEEVISLGIKNYATGEVSLQDNYPQPEPFFVNNIDLGENISALPSRKTIYESYMFHGPKYQGIEEVTHITKNGIRTILRNQEGKGSLLDNMGQTYGLFLHHVLDKDFVTFPVKVQDIIFYQDIYDQKGEFECICLSRSITDQFTVCDMVLKRDGKLWCVIKGWQNRRLESDRPLWGVTLSPGRNLLSQEIAPGVFYFHNAYKKSTSWGFLNNRYLNQPEKEKFETLSLNKRKDYLISRIALKDSLRAYVEKKYDKATFPIEYFLKYDSNNKPYVYGIKEIEGVEISLAHKGSDSVSIVSDKPVGIDIERIEERSIDFLEISFTPHELELIKDKDIAEWSTRLWVVKEAYGKMTGLGLQGNPKKYEVNTIIDDENIVIENCKVKLLKHKNFIVGWTL